LKSIKPNGSLLLRKVIILSLESMPELPEVETIKRDLEKILTGAILKKIIPYNLRFLEKNNLSLQEFKSLEGERLNSFLRKGKFLALLFKEKALILHLGLTGSLLLNSKNSSPSPHNIFSLIFDQGELLFRDPRKFGKVFLLSMDDLSTFLNHLGVDALELTFEELKKILQGHRGRVKNLLLNQRIIAGLGNIYTDELLFRAKISPFRRGMELSEEEIYRLYQEMQSLLAEAIALRGSSIRDYVDSEGKKGRFQEKHLVYGKSGTPCPICQTILKRTIIAQRGTTYCPNCQK
jgi:formamidopyrimidine-DNA glycosylase